MRRSTAWVLCIVAAAIFSSAGGAGAARVDCRKVDQRAPDEELSRYVAAARQRIADLTAKEGGLGATKDTLARFDASQAAWIDYRKAECEAVYDRWSDGTIRGAMYEGCWTSLTRTRTMEVWANWLTFMDDTPPLMPKPTDK